MPKFLTISEVDDQINELIDKVEAVIELAKSEDRDLTDDEMSIINDINDKQIPELEENRDFVAKIESVRGKKLARAAADGRVNLPSAPAEGPKSFSVPANCRNHGRTKAFENSHEGEKSAYVTGRWLAANFLRHSPSAQWLEDHGFRNALSGSDNAGAGVLVPLETSQAIIRLVEEYGIIRRFTTSEPMGSDRKIVPVRVGGMTAYPVAETNTNNQGSNTGTQSQPEYKNIELVARKWKAWCKMSDELNEDAYVDMGDQVAVESALAFAYAEDNSGFNGDSTSTYHGITGILAAAAAGSVKTFTAGDTSFGAIILSDLEEMVGMLPDFPGINPRWFISKEGYYASMHRLLMAAGGNEAGNLEEGGRPRFLGYDVVFTNTLNSTLTAQASTSLLVFGDLGMGVRFGDRRQISMSMSDERFWDEDQIAIKASERFDINVHSTGDASNPGCILVGKTPAS